MNLSKIDTLRKLRTYGRSLIVDLTTANIGARRFGHGVNVISTIMTSVRKDRGKKYYRWYAKAMQTAMEITTDTETYDTLTAINVIGQIDKASTLFFTDKKIRRSGLFTTDAPDARGFAYLTKNFRDKSGKKVQFSA